MDDGVSFVQFEIVPEEPWYGRPPIERRTRLHIESGLMTSARQGKVIVQEVTEESGVLIHRHRFTITTRVLECTAP